MLEKLKKLMGYGKEKPIEKEPPIGFREVKGSTKGSEIIAMSLNMLVNEMTKSYPEWNGLFNIGTNNGHVIVTCVKGFKDNNTQKAIPCLWRRKSFIESCRLMGVSRIVFLDSTNNTFDLLKVEDVDVSELP